MNYNRYSRIFIDQELNNDYTRLSEAQSHYLMNVMRNKIGSNLLIFNGKDGEFLAQIDDYQKKIVSLKIISPTRKQNSEPELILIFALIKNTRISYIIEKATELGVTKLAPVVTKHSVKDKFNLSKARSWVIEASEQSRRLSIPEIDQPLPLNKLIEEWDPDITILFANETEHQNSLPHIIQKLDKNKKYAILIGPEGGFSEDEINLLTDKSFVESFHLGHLTLRAETAAVCAISCVKLLLNHLSTREI